MSKSPRSGSGRALTPPEGSGVSGAVNTPAPLLFDQHATQGQAVPGYSVPMARKSRLFGSTQRHEQRAAESEQRVGDRWQGSTRDGAIREDARCPASKANTGRLRESLTSTGKADAVTRTNGRELATDAAKPTYTNPARRSPWWFWT